MEMKFGVTGESRKQLARIVGEILGTAPVYQGIPSYAYAIKDITISKDGTLVWDERTDGSTILDIVTRLKEGGFMADELAVDIPKPKDVLTIELPIEGFTEVAILNLERMIASKASLIKKALDVNSLSIERTETTLRFPWFSFGTPGDHVAAYAQLIGALGAAAQQQRRVTAREKEVENEKFAFRVFLIRLGFVGDEYKAARKILLRNLAGNSAFKTCLANLDESEDCEA